ncbi:LPXTG cell wall anchor domain-containing protein, partial [Bacteroides xylanisolvens]
DIGTMKTIFIIIIPAILLLIGVGIWFFRRRN